jgi:RNA polymerase sigma factor (sigma-70 family)
LPGDRAVQLENSIWLLRPVGAKPEGRPSRRVRESSIGNRQPSNRDALDGRLATAAREGNHAAYGAIVNRHKEWIYRYLKRHLQDEDDASDVLQDIFLTVWRYLGRYDPQRSFKVWLSQIVLNKTRDRVRRTAVQHAAQEALVTIELTCRLCAVCPETYLLRNEALQRIEAAIGALQPQYKEALVLTVIENLSDSDAAAQLHIKRKVIENRVLRAKERLASLLRVSDLRSVVSVGDPIVFP